mmetsp:Transcript_110881/g.318538  ORF Transcript_110881/g.318538 Transcript_110881/m.318538 type:complete len:306 (+) Transcript_110881:961-1878(+)
MEENHKLSYPLLATAGVRAPASGSNRVLPEAMSRRLTFGRRASLHHRPFRAKCGPMCRSSREILQRPTTHEVPRACTRRLRRRRRQQAAAGAASPPRKQQRADSVGTAAANDLVPNHNAAFAAPPAAARAQAAAAVVAAAAEVVGAAGAADAEGDAPPSASDSAEGHSLAPERHRRRHLDRSVRTAEAAAAEQQKEQAAHACCRGPRRQEDWAAVAGQAAPRPSCSSSLAPLASPSTQLHASPARISAGRRVHPRRRHFARRTRQQRPNDSAPRCQPFWRIDSWVRAAAALSTAGGGRRDAQDTL